MSTFRYRTEELTLSDVKEYYVESKEDRETVEYLKSQTPVVLVGSRGVGKSFLFRLAEGELIDNYKKEYIIPVYVTFRASSLIHTSNAQQFQSWMLSRICSEIIRALNMRGKLIEISRSFETLTGNEIKSKYENSQIETIAEAFENSWKNPDTLINTKAVPTLDEFLDSIEDICAELEIKRIVLFIDEAAHIFIPEQQRQFFTMFRDLRSAYIKCNASVYPGVTSYGNTFEPTHDAYFIMMNRDISDKNYIQRMKEIVLKQVTESTLAKNISTRGENFALLAYASDGNPRHLLKTVAQAQSMNSNDVNKVFREYYKTEIWAEHTGLADKYPGHRELVDWGREFIETNVLSELKQKNDKYLADGSDTSTYIWINRNAPQAVKEALRLLEYTGIISGHSLGMKSSKSQIGTRYTINLGCLISQEAIPSSTGFKIASALSIKRMTEYGTNHKQFESLIEKMPDYTEPNMSLILKAQLNKSVELLDLTQWQISKLIELNLNTIGDVLLAPEARLMEAYNVAQKRARTMKNAALASVYEYLSG